MRSSWPTVVHCLTIWRLRPCGIAHERHALRDPIPSQGTAVNQRTQEIGVRMALGAQPAGILRLVVGEGLRVALIGIGVGLLGGLALGSAVSSLVYGVTVRDPGTYAAVAASLMLTALAA